LQDRAIRGNFLTLPMDWVFRMCSHILCACAARIFE